MAHTARDSQRYDWLMVKGESDWRTGPWTLVHVGYGQWGFETEAGMFVPIQAVAVAATERPS